MPDALRPAVTRLLAGVVVVDDLATARRAVEAQPGLVAVTREGDLLGREHAAGGSATTPSLLEVQAAVDEATTRLGEAGHRIDRARFALQAALDEQTVATRDVQAALDRLHESDARMAAVAEQLGQLGAQARAARGEADRLDRSIALAVEQLDVDRAALAELEERHAAAAASGPVTDGPDDERSPTPRCATSSRRPPGQPGRPRWSTGSPSAPARSGSGRCPAGPTSWPGPRPRSARTGPGRGAPGPPGPRGGRGPMRAS